MVHIKAPKKEIAKLLAERLDNVTIADASHFVDVYEEVILDLLEDYDDVKIGNLVTIKRDFIEGYDKKLPDGDSVYIEHHHKLRAVIAEKYKKRYL